MPREPVLICLTHFPHNVFGMFLIHSSVSRDSFRQGLFEMIIVYSDSIAKQMLAIVYSSSPPRG